MKIITSIKVSLLFIFFANSCIDEPERKDLVNDSFTDSQEEIREAVHTIVKDAETANLEGLKRIHLESDKFTKFGPRIFERQDVEKTNDSELAFFGTVDNYKEEISGLKVDVFGEVGIATYYRSVSFDEANEEKKASLRQTLVFLKTEEGWKIAHEHGTREIIGQ